jgi:hypothetical protein
MKTKIIRSGTRDFAEIVLFAALKRANLDREILSAPQTEENTRARGKIYAMMRAHTSRKCLRLSWSEIARVCGVRNRPSVYFPIQRFEESEGKIEAWSIDEGRKA